MSTGRSISGGGTRALVELPERRRPSTSASPPASASASMTSSTRSTTRPPRIANTWTTPPLGPSFRPKTSRSDESAAWPASAGARPASARCACASRSWAASSKRSASAAACHALAQRVAPARRCAPRAAAGCWPPPRRSAPRCRSRATHGAMQRLMSYSRHGRPRRPVITSLHDRMPNSRCESTIVRRAKLRRQERAGVEVAVLLVHAARHEQPGERLARRQPQVRIVLVVAEQDVVPRRPLLDEVVLERQRLHHRVGDDHLEAWRSRRAGRRDAGSCPRRPGSCARGRAASGPCRRRSCRRPDCPTDTRQAAPGDARSAP